MKYHYFFLTMATPDQINTAMQLVDDCECTLVQLIPGQVQPPGNALTLPGTQARPVDVLQALVKIEAEKYPALVEKLKSKAADVTKLQGTRPAAPGVN